jgi:hypothetical protein
MAPKYDGLVPTLARMEYRRREFRKACQFSSMPAFSVEMSWRIISI